MLKRIASVLLVGSAAVIGLGAATAVHRGSDPGLTVHEWGTFTSVADANGLATEWLPLGGPSDLPCFVKKDGGGILKVVPQNDVPLNYETAKANLWGKVRMETPVLYFYSDRDMKVDVRVDFHRGLITEFYPTPASFQPGLSANTLRDPQLRGYVAWKNVEISPKAHPAFPTTSGESHYYAARATDAAPLFVNDQAEKFLFYRGVASFDVPILTEALGDTAVRVAPTRSSEPLPLVILFENRSGKLGYTVGGSLTKPAVLRAPTLTGSADGLRGELLKALVAGGLTDKEASAMLATWRDSWFEEGTRVFYVMPPKTVNDILPLAITPAANAVVRVFVGRQEVITPRTVKLVRDAALVGDSATLRVYGRFLSPITDRILAAGGDAATALKIRAANKAAFDSYVGKVRSCR